MPRRIIFIDPKHHNLLLQWQSPHSDHFHLKNLNCIVSLRAILAAGAQSLLWAAEIRTTNSIRFVC